MLSFEEAAREYARLHKVSMDVARLAVTDDYFEEDRRSEEQVRAKMDPLVPDNGMFYHPRPKREGRPVRIESLPSPAWLAVKNRAVARAKFDGDHYRNLSRHTSMHLIGE